MAFTMTDSQQTTLHASAVDKRGNAVAFDAGSVQFLVDNPNVLTLTPGADGVSCAIVAAGPTGNATVTVNATVGGPAVAGTWDVTVTSGAPTQITVTADAPTEQP